MLLLCYRVGGSGGCGGQGGWNNGCQSARRLMMTMNRRRITVVVVSLWIVSGRRDSRIILGQLRIGLLHS